METFIASSNRNPLSPTSDRAKERRDDKNPDYVGTESEGQSLHNVAPPGQATGQQLYTDAHLLSIENSKILGKTN
jgi:hypothetical protein